MDQLDSQYQDYQVFKGLQKPLEFLGFQGRYIFWAAGTVGGGVVAFIVGFISIGFIAALIMATVILGFGGVMTFIKQRKGLHTKKEEKGIYIFAHSRSFL